MQRIIDRHFEAILERLREQWWLPETDTVDLQVWNDAVHEVAAAVGEQLPKHAWRE